MDGFEKSGLCGSVWWLCVPQLFQQFTHFVQLFHEIRMSTSLLCTTFKYKLFIKILSSSLNTMLIVDKHSSVVCCDEFLVPRISGAKN